MTKEEKLQNLHKRWIKDCKCGLRKEATQAVPGAGSASADIVLIGEAPGKNEDKQGVPFVGAAGKFLDEMLANINLERKDVYITNVVKYRPPNNRDPLPEEVADCTGWLEEELSLVKPKIIVLLGRYALRHFFPKESISSVHGKTLEKKTKIGNIFMVMYHPAAALHNGSLREVLTEDFKKLPEVIERVGS